MEKEKKRRSVTPRTPSPVASNKKPKEDSDAFTEACSGQPTSPAYAFFAFSRKEKRGGGDETGGAKAEGGGDGAKGPGDQHQQGDEPMDVEVEVAQAIGGARGGACGGESQPRATGGAVGQPTAGSVPTPTVLAQVLGKPVSEVIRGLVEDDPPLPFLLGGPTEETIRRLEKQLEALALAEANKKTKRSG